MIGSPTKQSSTNRMKTIKLPSANLSRLNRRQKSVH
jgi:hypothetical protein